MTVPDLFPLQDIRPGPSFQRSDEDEQLPAIRALGDERKPPMNMEEMNSPLSRPKGGREGTP